MEQQITGMSRLYSEVGQSRKKLGMELIQQKSLLPLPFLDSLDSSLNVSVNNSWFGLIMLSRNFYVTVPLLTPMAKSTLWKNPWPLCPSLVKPEAWQGSILEACSMGDNDSWCCWKWSKYLQDVSSIIIPGIQRRRVRTGNDAWPFSKRHQY